ncbi:MAG: flagellar basal body rod protein FlgB [Weizmannia coagulans]|jgi:flagellar basal-body rod protein FlgB|uniref:flagellar basal body rod protein FlgB n=1 Tax=Heyndrickxia TaxID=2837504 RepID=UPI00054D0461|nr:MULTISPECIES: flagellar basal body rod protein FlgB [Heyndrickxia]AWP36739.1 flagellar basal body rod protein FlgB [Heyndrickxia coagulans]KGT39627.1 flagellar basal body rod protein FlgB [Heyndrickxia coagulans P38]MCI1575909.1 flagellar basal body rod protein FlgB [Heyndrickxia coagulans]MED4321053.1 flagellar basal body rod protein FlgB [Weizmannia sp. CD-2023]MED4839621.1 flagellar basal body rod protein FlgB [Weizmannia sp. CD-2023]
MSLSSNTLRSLEHALQYASLRQKVISNNIANADTPNYKAQDVSFKNVLEDSVNAISANRTDPRHFRFSAGDSSPEIVTESGTTYNSNGNSVDIDTEMANLASNQIYYESLIELEKGKLSSLLNVVRGGQ